MKVPEARQDAIAKDVSDLLENIDGIGQFFIHMDTDLIRADKMKNRRASFN